MNLLKGLFREVCKEERWRKWKQFLGGQNSIKQNYFHKICWMSPPKVVVGVQNFPPNLLFAHNLSQDVTNCPRFMPNHASKPFSIWKRLLILSVTKAACVYETWLIRVGILRRSFESHVDSRTRRVLSSWSLDDCNTNSSPERVRVECKLRSWNLVSSQGSRDLAQWII